MAKICAMCGKKLGFLQDPMWLSQDDSDEVICYDCWILVNDLNCAKNIQDVEDAKQALKPFFASHEVRQDVKDILKKDVEKAYEKLKKKQEKVEEERRELEKRSERINMFTANELITTGYNFEGYEITKYCGLISGEVVLGTGFMSEFSASIADLFGSASNSFSNKMRQVKEAATNQLIKNAIMKGGNAVIGVDFDYITFGNNMIGISANGTAVVAKKIEE